MHNDTTDQPSPRPRKRQLSKQPEAQVHEDMEAVLEATTMVIEDEAQLVIETEGVIAAESESTTLQLDHLKGILESVIFASDKPLPASQLARTIEAPKPQVLEALILLAEEYRSRGIELVELAGGYQFRSAARNAPFVRDFVGQKPMRLTRAQLETLAIIAYRQPVTRPEIDEIRGVDTASALKLLLDRHLVKILGKKEDVGRPLLYGTSPYFLEFFGLNKLGDLPTLRDFAELNDESRALFETQIGPMDMHEPGAEPAAQAQPELEVLDQEEIDAIVGTENEPNTEAEVSTTASEPTAEPETDDAWLSSQEGAT